MSPRRTTTSTVAFALRKTASRLRWIEAQLQYARPEYVVAHGGYLVENTAIGALSALVSTYPEWALNADAYIVFDAGTVEAEVRKITSVGTYDYQVAFTPALQYNHSAEDPILFLVDSRINVFWTGAIGDGVADDTLALQRAVAQFALLGGTDGSIYIPSGIYKITSPITLTGPLRLQGEGRAVTILRGTMAAGDPMLRFTATPLANISITDMKLENSGSGAGCDGIRWGAAIILARVYIERVWIHAMTGYGINADYMQESSISDCLITNCNAGIRIKGGSDFIYRNRFQDNGGIGIEIVDSNDIIVNSNVVFGSGIPPATSEGLRIQNSFEVSVFANSFYGNETDIRTSGCHDISIMANHALNSAAAAVYGLTLLNVASNRVTVTGNLTGNNPAGGILTSVASGDILKFYSNHNAESPQVTLSQSLTGDSARGDHYSEWIAADEFILVDDTPVLGHLMTGVGLPIVWDMPDLVLSSVGVWWRVPSNLYGANFTVRIHPYFYTVVGSNIVIGLRYLAIAPGGSLVAAALTTGNITVATVNGVLCAQSVSLPLATFSASGIMALRLTLYRDATAVADTYAADLQFLGMEINFE